MTNYYEDRQDSITLAQAFNLVHAEWLAASKLVDETTQEKFVGRVNYIYALLTHIRKRLLEKESTQKGLNL